MVVVVALGVIFAMMMYFFVRVRWHNQALVLMSNEQYEDAIRIFSRVIRFYPYNRANIYKRQGNHDAALADHDQAIAKGGRMSAMMYGARAYFLMYLGRHEEALSDYQMALQADPTQPQAQLGVAYAYVFMKQYDKALEQAEHVIQNLEAQIAKNTEFGAYIVTHNSQADAQLESTYISVYATKALALIHLGRVDEGKAIYESLAQKYPNSMILYTDRAEIHFLLNEFASAVADYEKALNLAQSAEHMLTTSGYDLSHLAQGGYAVALFADGQIEKAQAQWRDLATKIPRLTSQNQISKEFFWSEPMTAQAEKLIASLNA
jgi:tetratricopeptide (TPR) repeat protein